VPEWGNLTVYYRGWTGKERDNVEQHFGGDDEKNRPNKRARLLVRTLLDANGDRLFHDSDADALGDKNSVVIDRLFDLVSKLNQLTKNAAEDTKKN
jgi:hypothetical protein